MSSSGDVRYLERRKAVPLITLHVMQLAPPTQPNLSDEKKAVIEALRRYLKRAEAGNMPGLCIASVDDNNMLDAECYGTYERFPADAIGPLELLKLKVTRKALDGN